MPPKSFPVHTALHRYNTLIAFIRTQVASKVISNESAIAIVNVDPETYREFVNLQDGRAVELGAAQLERATGRVREALLERYPDLTDAVRNLDQGKFLG